jgi:YD repeat-containing protein
MTTANHPALAEPLRSFTSVLQVILLTGFGLPAHAAPQQSRSRASGTAQAGTSLGTLAKTKTALGQLQTRAALATKAALNALNPPNEFSLLKSRFQEPLIATGPSSVGEDAALFWTLRLFRDRTVEDDLSALDDFVKSRPNSPWRLSLLTNIGLLDYHYGYFGRAIDSWSKAWLEGKAADSKSKLLVDRAVGELARMHARLGHADALEALFKDIGNRPISGAATEAIAGAREGLSVMRSDPGIAYLCGPMALKNLLLSLHSDYNQVGFLDAVRSGPRGVTLAEVSLLADQAKLPHHVVFRDTRQPVPVPSIIHWKVSHFAAIVGSDGKRFHVADPTFGTDLWVTQAAIDDGSDGYFLVPSQTNTLAWRDATAAESSKVRGMGYPGGVETGDCCLSSIPAQNPQAGSAAPDHMMAGYRFTEMLVNLSITDTPVGYAPPKGPSAYVTVAYNQREADQPATFSYFNLGQKWTLNWLSYIEDDPNKPGASVSRYVAGGGYINYFGYSSGTFTPEPRDASVLSRSTTGAITYQRALADGSVQIYSASNGATTYPRLIFLTKILDTAGNSVTLSYDNQQRLTSMTDATGRLTTFSYGLPGSPCSSPKSPIRSAEAPKSRTTQAAG